MKLRTDSLGSLLSRPLLPARGATTPRRAWIAVIGAIVFSCMPQSQVVAPQVDASQTLDLAGGDSGRPAAFSLVHAAPQGSTNGDPQIHLVFSRALRALDVETPPPQEIVLSPTVAGHWEWVGVYGLTFVPETGRLPRATAFEVTVPATLQALDHTELGQTTTLRFETPRPLLSGASPNQRWGVQLPTESIELAFSQPISPEALRPFLSISAGEEKPDFTLEQGDTPEQVRVRPQSAWPLASTIKYHIAPGFVGQEGPLPAEREFDGAFQTYGPLTAEVDCYRKDDGSCRPEGGLRLELSNPVPALQLANSVRAQGALLHIDRDWGPHSTTRYLSLDSQLVPRSQFTISVGPVKDIYGQTLKWVKNRQVVVSDLRPQVRIGFDGEVLPIENDKIGILSVNASFELVTAPLSEAQFLGTDEQLPTRVSDIESLAGARSQQIAVGALNETKRHIVQLSDIVARGPFVMGIRYQSEGEQEEQVRRGQRTDLGITVKQGRDSSHIWLTNLTSGAPVAGARVKLVGKSDVVTTDAQGLAQLPAGLFLAQADHERDNEWLHVVAEQDEAYRSSNDTVGSWRVPVMTDYYGDPSDVAFLFPERDLLRPGEKVWLKGYVRRPEQTGSRPLAAQDFQLDLHGPTGELVSTQKVRTNRYGAIAAQVEVPGSAQLGYWSVQLTRSDESFTSTSLQVAEYRPAEFEVAIQSDLPEVVAGQPVNWGLNAGYLYGGVMSNARVEYNVARRPSYFSPPNSQDYETLDSTWQYQQSYKYHDPILSSDAAELDGWGKWKLSSKSQLKDQVGPEVLALEATVHDVSGQTITATGTVLVHPADYYVGIKYPDSYLIDAPGTFTPKVRAIQADGKLVSGRPIKLELYRLRWTYARQQGPAGGDETVSELVMDLVSSCQTTSALSDQGCQLSVRNSGEHIVRATSADSKGRITHSSTGIYALGGGGASTWRDYDERGSVELSADRKTYQPGQNARILVKSPFEKARAWVTLERDNVTEQRLVTLSGPSPTITVPITDAMRPNVFVSVHLLEDRAALAGKAHRIGDSYRFGYTELRIDPERQRLQVTATADKKEYRPGDEVALRLHVADTQKRGRQAEVTVFVVDEGVLSLSGYQLPDPLQAFTGPRPLRVETIEARENVARLFGLEAISAENKGDPGGDGGDVRSESLTCAYFNPAIETDKSGNAEVRFKLPDNLGRFRIMALAVTDDDRYGKGQSSFNVNRPLMVRPALPRFVRAGDELQLSAVVSSFGAADGKVEVRAQVQGLQLQGPATASIDLPPNASRMVNFTARALSPGEAQIQFDAQLAEEKDAVRLQRQIASPAITETTALYGKTNSAEAFALGSLQKARPDIGGLEVTLSSSALVGLKGGFSQLWDYPYLCSEQLSSRILPLVMLQELASLYGVEAPKDAPARIEQAMSDLLRRQMGNGGFGMWSESREAQPWVSAYALWVLYEAKNKGYPVPTSVFERGGRYLRDIAALRNNEELGLAAFATFVLSRLGQGDKNSVHALFEHSAQMDVESRFLLAWAAAGSGAKAVQSKLLQQLEGSITLRGNQAEITAPHGDYWASIFGSPVRLHAIALNALLALAPGHRMAAPLVRSLLSARKAGRWNNTQETAFALLGLNAYQQAQEQLEPRFDAFVFLRDKLLGQKHFAGRSTASQEFSVAMQDLLGGGDLIFQQKGSGTLFFEARLQYARSELPTDSLESGFLVKKDVRAFSPGMPAVGSADEFATGSVALKHGDLVLVDVTVLAPTRRRFVVVDDPLPAGLEPIDLSQNTAQSSLSKLIGYQQPGYAQAWHREELRDDRVLYFIDDMPPGVYRYRYLARATTRGRFVTPPTVVKEMYQEEVYGRTRAVEVVVK